MAAPPHPHGTFNRIVNHWRTEIKGLIVRSDGVDTSCLERSLRMYEYIQRQVAGGRLPRFAYMAAPCAEMATMLVEQIDVARIKARRADAQS